MPKNEEYQEEIRIKGVKYWAIMRPQDHQVSPRGTRLGLVVCVPNTFEEVADEVVSKVRLIESRLMDRKFKGVYLPLYWDRDDELLSTKKGKLSGYIYANNASIRNWMCVSRVTNYRKDAAKRLLEAEVAEYSEYIRGETYTAEVFKEGSNDPVDSIGSMYGHHRAVNEVKDLLRFLEGRDKYELD